MPARIRTDYPGVTYRIAKRVGGKGEERVFYVRYKKDGNAQEEKAGRQYADNMTPSKANYIRSQLIQGKRLTRKEKREKEAAAKRAEENRWTIDRLWESYSENRKPGPGLIADKARYNKHLKKVFGDMMPQEIEPLEVRRLCSRLSKKLAPQTVKHVLNLLIWITNYGANNQLSEGLSFRVEKPKVNNVKTEFLTPDQIEKLLITIDSQANYQVGNLMKVALFTGMRKGELLNLQWRDLDFDRGFITIRDPKGGKDEIIPMNDQARAILEAHPRDNSKYVFPGKDGGKRVTIDAAARKIKKAAGLPKDFRALHGLRHVYASILAGSGEVDMYVLQKLLTHKDSRMTQRYAHLRNETLKKASQVGGDILSKALNGQNKKRKVVNLKR